MKMLIVAELQGLIASHIFFATSRLTHTPGF